MAEQEKITQRGVSVGDAGQLARNLRRSPSVDGRGNRPVGADAHERMRAIGEKAIREGAARRIGRSDPDSIKY